MEYYPVHVLQKSNPKNNEKNTEKLVGSWQSISKRKLH